MDIQSRSDETNGVSQQTDFSRLPTNVVPSHYNLTIRPELSNFTFAGSETVDVQVHERTKTIVLHALDIAIQSASFASTNQSEPLCLPFIEAENLSVKIFNTQR